MMRHRWMLAVVLAVVASALPLLPTAPTTPAQAFSACLTNSAEDTLTFAGNQLLATVDDLSSTAAFPRSTDSSGDWTTRSASDWTSGFFAGLLWQIYLHTGADAFRSAAEAWSTSLASQATRTDTHDVGFMVGIPASLAYEATGDTGYQDTLLTAAASLASRYDADVGAIRSWDFGGWTFPVIVDNMMNLELLRQGADATPSSSTATTWRAIASSHSARTASDHVRSDGSTYHLVDYDDATGDIIGRQTHAGAADDSTWARGQAWAIHGFTTMYRETSAASDLAAARKVADYFIDNLPADKVPYWDFDAPGIPSAAKDSSAAAIAASGLLELADLTSGSDATRYFAAACDILDSLMSPAYLSNGASSAGILLHGTGNHPAGTEIDVSLIYADFYFVEALIRYLAMVPPTPPPVDTTDPVITLSGANPQTIRVGGPYVELGATATDVVDGDLTASITIDASGVNTAQVGSYSVVYRVTDAAGNSESASRTVDVVMRDDPPTIELIGSNPQVIGLGNPYVELGATAFDAIDGDLTSDITTDADALDITEPGMHQVRYAVTDSSGSTTDTLRTIHVVDFFTDDDASIFQAEVNAIALAGITKGCNPPTNDRYCLAANVTRSQFAAMIVRAFGFTERAPDPFRDDDGSIFEADIERLFASGVTRGCNPPANDRFCEDRFLTRGQAAAMFVRAFGYTNDGGGDLFDDDDGSVFEADIDRLATAGVTKGCNPSEGNTRFCPDALITRGQIAAFLARAFNL